MLDVVNVRELPLLIPVFVKQRIISLQLLRYFADHAQVLLSLVAADAVVTACIVLNFDPDEFLAADIRHDEPQIKAPHHDYEKHQYQRHHHVLVLDFIEPILVCHTFLLSPRGRIQVLRLRQVDAFEYAVEVIDPVDGGDESAEK